MAITSQALVEKMLIEATAASKQTDHQKVREHVRAIRLLCDIVLDENVESEEPTSRITKQNIDQQELLKMMGSKSPSPKINTTAPADNVKVNHEEANGNSLFDF